MNCAVQIYMVLGGLHVYKSVFLGWVVGRINIAVNGEHNCGVLPYASDKMIVYYLFCPLHISNIGHVKSST